MGGGGPSSVSEPSAGGEELSNWHRGHAEAQHRLSCIGPSLRKYAKWSLSIPAANAPSASAGGVAIAQRGVGGANGACCAVCGPIT